MSSLGERPSAPSRNAAVMVALEIALVDEGVASTAVLPPPPDVSSPDPVKTVQVKFVLQKQCAFGQQFIVVGDDPALGLWDPTKATVLDWSEGHVWTAKKDLPASKSIEFKFLLRDPSGQVCWQHGCNRTLQITETSNVLVVHEDWDDAECQKLSEEVDVSIGADVIFAGSDDPLLDENQEHSNGVMTVVSTDSEKTSAVVIDASLLPRERMWVNGANQSQSTLDQKVPEVLRRRANMVAQNGNPAAAAGDHDGRIILYEEGAPAGNRLAGMFENDIVWIRKALQRLLRSVGLRIGTRKT